VRKGAWYAYARKRNELSENEKDENSPRAKIHEELRYWEESEVNIIGCGLD
jgi:hypothetical protein